MGLPQIKISFESKALNIIKRSERGIMLLFLKESKTETLVYNSFLEVKESDYTPKNYKLIEMAFWGGCKNLIVEKVENFEKFVEIIKKYEDKKVDYVVAPEIGEQQNLLITWIKEQRAKEKTTKAVVYNGLRCDSEAIINFTTESVTVDGKYEYTGAEYTVRIAGILAGLPLDRSATHFELPEITAFSKTENPDVAVDQGKLFIIEQYGNVKLSRAVNSLTTTSSKKSKQFTKIKIIEGMDLIINDIKETFAKDYVGKVINSAVNKRIFLDVLNGIYFKELQGNVLDPEYNNKLSIDFEANKKYAKIQGENVDGMTEAEILHYPTGSEVFLSGKIKFVDAMEDLTINFSI